MESYIDKYSWRCLLGKMAKNITETDTYATWTVNKTRHIIIFKSLEDKDLDWIEQYIPCNFHYFSTADTELLKSRFKIIRSKGMSVMLELDKTLNPTGKRYRGIRNKINRFKTLQLSVLDNYKDFNDIKNFIINWRENYAEKYFRDNSGKNLHFYMNDFHYNCISSFCYDDDKIMACGTLSPPKNGYSAYIIGKALYKENPILSEFIDFSLYKKAYELGTRFVTLGFSSNKGLLLYKQKFPGLTTYVEYSGTIKGKK